MSCRCWDSTACFLQIITGLKKNYEKYHNVKIADDAVEAAVDLSMRYLQDKFLPDKAIDLIDEAASTLKVNSTKIGRAKNIHQYEERLKKTIKEKEQAILAEEFTHALALKEQENELILKIDDLHNLAVSNQKYWVLLPNTTSLLLLLASLAYQLKIWHSAKKKD